MNDDTTSQLQDTTADDGVDGDDLYARLARPFDETFWDTRGGVDLEYVTGEQVTSRLNETLGFLTWSFRVLEHGIHQEADECWVMGELTVTIDGHTVTHQQFGSQRLKRSRSSGTPLDIGFDLKGATTDCLKKCATLVGVGLWLSAKEAGPDGKPIPKGRPERRPGGRPSADSRLRQMANDAPPPKPPAATESERPAVACKECTAVIWPDREIQLKKKTITGQELLEKSRAEFKKALCLTCFEHSWASRHEASAAAAAG